MTDDNLYEKLESRIAEAEKQKDDDELNDISVELSELYRTEKIDKETRNEFFELINDAKSKVKNANEDGSTNEDDEFALDYNHGLFEIHMDSLDVLNTDNLPYPEFLRDVIIPTFHPLPYPEIQNPIMATICLINSASIPAKSERNAKEVPLSPVYIQGASGTGKSQLTHLISRHYNNKRCVSVSGSNTGGDLIQKMTDACYRSGSLRENNLKLFPSCIFMENFYNRDLQRWGNFNVQLLATERSFATTARQGKDAKTFYTFLLKVFTSVQPLQAITEQNVELLRRTIRIFTERFVPSDSTAKYDWSLCKKKYLEIWQPENVHKNFYPILQKVVTKSDDETFVPSHYYLPSQIIIATGVFLGIWQSLEEAEDHMAEYWKLVDKMENKTGKPYLETFQERLKGYWAEFEIQYQLFDDEKKADKIASQSYLLGDSIVENTFQRHGNFYKKNEISEALQYFMQSKGFKYTTDPTSKKPVFRRF